MDNHQPQPQQPQHIPYPQPQLYPQYPPQQAPQFNPQPAPPSPVQPAPQFQPNPQAQLPPPQQQAPAQQQQSAQLPPDGIDRSQITRVQPEIFTVDFLIDGMVQGGIRLQAMNLSSMLAQLMVLSAINMPRVNGWNVYDAAGRLVATTSMVDFVAYVAGITTLCRTPADKSAAGWRAMPVVTQTTPDFQAERDRAKKEGRLPQ